MKRYFNKHWIDVSINFLILVLTATQAVAISIGDRIECTTSGLNIRPSASTSGDPLAQANTGDLGVVGGGPYSGSSYTWYYVTWDKHPAGYSISTYLQSVDPSAPTQNSPGNASGPGPTISTLTPTISWNTSLGATGYGVYVEDLGTSSLVYDNDAVGNVTSIALPSGTLQWGRSYVWNMRANDSVGYTYCSTHYYFQTQTAPQPPTHDIASQFRADTDTAMSDPATIPSGVGVYFQVTPTDPQGNTVRMEVEWHQLPATFTGTANLVSSYVASGSHAVTATITGLAAGNYGWAYRVADSQGLASDWVPANNPDFSVEANTPILALDSTGVSVSASSGSTSFHVSNTGSGTMTYSATVSGESGWLTITSGGSGVDSGAVNISFPANNGAQRSGTIVVTASGALGSPATFTVTQAQSASSSPFQIDNRVMSSPPSGVDGIYVRSSPPDLTRIPGSDQDYDQYAGVHGTIIGGPLIGTAGGFTGNWWQINWDAGIDGWSAESVLAIAPPEGDFSEPNFASSFYSSIANIFWESGNAPALTSPPNPQLGSALGNCTWYANGRLLQLGFSPTALEKMNGNAGQWASEAVGPGISVDVTPAVHSIAQVVTKAGFSEGHVAVVESVNPDGTITVTESSYTSDANSPWNILWRNRTVAPVWFDNFIHVPSASAGGGAAPPKISPPVISGYGVTIPTTTEVGYDYVLEFKNSLADPSWTPLQTNSGNGDLINVSDPGISASSRFYRVRVQ